MWQLQNDWSLLWIFVFVFICLIKVVIVEAVACTSMMVGMCGQYYEFLVGSVRVSLPECLKRLWIWKLECLLWGHAMGWLFRFAELHVLQDLSQVKMNFIDVLSEAAELVVLIFGRKFVDGVEYQTLRGRRAFSTVTVTGYIYKTVN